jgi:hypothetical protein
MSLGCGGALKSYSLGVRSRRVFAWEVSISMANNRRISINSFSKAG